MRIDEFLLARIAEDEAVARAAMNGAADDGRWRQANPANDALGDAERVEGVGIVIYPEGGHTPAQAAHIARQDPARVLAECEAKRRIVEMHPIYRGERLQPIRSNGPDFGCENCDALSSIDSSSLIEAGGNCETLCALSLPYADHPDYDEAWRI